MEDIGKEARRKMANTRIPFTNKILCVGCGGVAQCTLPIIPKLIDVPLSNITVIDKVNTREKIEQLVRGGVRFFVEEIHKHNFKDILAKYLGSGDVLIDLAYEIATEELLRWCKDAGVLYVNASVEIWDPYMDPQKEDARKFTLYNRHTAIRKLKEDEWGGINDGPTAVLDHGANPGLVSHFVKLGLEHIAEKIIKERGNVDPARTLRIETNWKQQAWGALAMELGLKVIHISERDTQVTQHPKLPGEFVNTWSPEGFYEEAVAPAELGWGTHERTLPCNALQHIDGPQNQILLKSKGMNTTVRSWLPMPRENDGDIVGFVVRHGEAFTISDNLTVRNDQGTPIYRPTVHYAYRPSDSAVASLDELRMRHYHMHKNMRVLTDEIISGQDILGCLLMGHDFKSWWIGSLLDIHEARELVPHQNATTMQVAISIASAIQWMIKNPKKGVCVPDDLPHNEILEQCYPWLGPFVSRPVDWTPLAGIKDEKHVEYERIPVPREDEEWQFSSFLVNSF